MLRVKSVSFVIALHLQKMRFSKFKFSEWVSCLMVAPQCGTIQVLEITPTL